MHSASLLYRGTFLMGLHSTLFGPVKYAYSAAASVARAELVGGNGLVEMGTFVAILLGTIAGGAVAGLAEHGTRGAGRRLHRDRARGRASCRASCRVTAAADPTCSSTGIRSPRPGATSKFARENRTVFLSLLGHFVALVLRRDVPVVVLHLREGRAGRRPDVVTAAARGVLGRHRHRLAAVRKALGGKVEIGLVPFGSIGMTVFAVDLYFAIHASAAGRHLSGVGDSSPRLAHWRVLADLFLLAMFGGFYFVPLYALIQTRCEPSASRADHRRQQHPERPVHDRLGAAGDGRCRGRLHDSGLSWSPALLNAVVAIYIYSLVPEFLMRFLAGCWCTRSTGWSLCMRSTFRRRARRVIVCNHVSFVDALVIMAACPRPIRFVMDHYIFRIAGRRASSSAREGDPDRAGAARMPTCWKRPTTSCARR